jgi:cold shock protein
MQQPTEEVAVRGVVKKWDDARGFGFIGTEGGGKDVFVHYSKIQSEAKRRTLEKGQLVEFELDYSERGPEARNVRIVKA